MRLSVLLMALTILFSIAPTASATTTGEWDVAGLRPFTAETNYMSLAGYFRWCHWQESGVCLSMMEARRILKSEGINPDAR